MLLKEGNILKVSYDKMSKMSIATDLDATIGGSEGSWTGETKEGIPCGEGVFQSAVTGSNSFRI